MIFKWKINKKIYFGLCLDEGDNDAMNYNLTTMITETGKKKRKKSITKQENLQN